MPLNMNTIGMGNGPSGGSGGSGGFTMLKPPINQSLTSKFRISELNQLNVTRTVLYSASIADTFPSAYSMAAPPEVQYKEYYYGTNSWYRIDIELYRLEINSNGSAEINSVTCTKTKITPPVNYIRQIFAWGEYMYIIANPSYSTSEFSDIQNDKLYRYDGSSFTAISESLGNVLEPVGVYYSSEIRAPYYFQKVIHSSDNNLYCIVTMGDDNGSDSSYSYDPTFFVVKITPDGEFSVVAKIYPDYQIYWSYSGTDSERSNYLDLFYNYFGYNSKEKVCVLSISFTDSTIDIYCTQYYVKNGHATSGTAYLTKNTLKYTLEPLLETASDGSTHKGTLTLVSSENLASQYMSTTNNSSTGYTLDDYLWLAVFPISSVPCEDVDLVMIHKGHTQYSYCGGGTSAYDSEIETKVFYHSPTETTHKTIPSIGSSMNYIYQGWPNLNYGRMHFLFEENPPMLFVSYQNVNSDDIYNRIYPITFDAELNPSESSFQVTVPLLSGDTVYCNAGIISFTDSDGSSTDLNGVTSYTITTDDTYTFTTHVYSTYEQPEFIIQTNDGYLLNTRASLVNNNDLGCYVSAGMKVNGEPVDENGYNLIEDAFSNGRVVISM